MFNFNLSSYKSLHHPVLCLLALVCKFHIVSQVAARRVSKMTADITRCSADLRFYLWVHIAPTRWKAWRGGKDRDFLFLENCSCKLLKTTCESAAQHGAPGELKVSRSQTAHSEHERYEHSECLMMWYVGWLGIRWPSWWWLWQRSQQPQVIRWAYFFLP